MQVFLLQNYMNLPPTKLPPLPPAKINISDPPPHPPPTHPSKGVSKILNQAGGRVNAKVSNVVKILDPPLYLFTLQ